MELDEIDSCKLSKPGRRLLQHHSWQQHSSSTSSTSRIYRVSRTSSGKDRHSKVITAKGLRDRRVRLSVSTAIQFYDLQDRLGYDQPSKAIEWLIKAAADAITELPELEGSFLEPQNPGTADEDDQQQEQQQQQQPGSLSKSGCSSTSETSKGSVLSLSQSEICTQDHKRAAKDEPHASAAAQHQHSISPSLNSPNSFTELLISGGGGSSNAATAGASPKQLRQLPPATTTADYFGQVGLFTQSHKNPPPSFGFSFTQFGNPTAGDHSEIQQFSFLQDHLIPVAASAAPEGDYGLNFSISPGLTAYNRGTLQSNSPSQFPQQYIQRLSSPVDGSSLPVFFGTPTVASAESQYSAGLQLCYGDGYKYADLKGKGKS